MNQPTPPQQPGPFGPPPPFGQQPQQPYVQPSFDPQPPPFGQEPVQAGNYPQDPAGQPVKKGGRRRLTVIAIALVVIAAGAFAAVYFTRNDPGKANAGDCIKVNSANEQKADVEKIDCNSQEAVFKVAKKLSNDTDKCPTEGYEKYTQSGGSSGDFALCLMLNGKEGDCFANFETSSKLSRVDCGNADVKVAKVVAGKADDSACDQDGVPLTYPEPATTFCLAQP
jgi:hypothetical protein